MEKIPYVGPLDIHALAPGLHDIDKAFLRQDPVSLHRYKAVLSGVIALNTIAALAVSLDRLQDDKAALSIPTLEFCLDDSCLTEPSKSPEPLPTPTSTKLPTPVAITAESQPKPTTAPKVAVSPAPKVAPKPGAQPSPTPAPTRTQRGSSGASREVLPGTGLDPIVAEKIRSMQLSPEGYKQYLSTIDRSHFDYAQQFVEFDPDRVPIQQGRSKLFVWHFTAFYRNADGPSETAKGDMLIPPFIKGLATRGDTDPTPDHVCCGVNWLIDRHGPAHQLAPLNAKLRHNPPYDSINTGVEIEAATKTDITTRQYEATAYLTIAVLQNQKLLGTKPLSEIAKGHGEMRDAYRSANPDSHWGVRNDFDAPESSALRKEIETFLKAHPEVPGMTTRIK